MGGSASSSPAVQRSLANFMDAAMSTTVDGLRSTGKRIKKGNAALSDAMSDAYDEVNLLDPARQIGLTSQGRGDPSIPRAINTPLVAGAQMGLGAANAAYRGTANLLGQGVEGVRSDLPKSLSDYVGTGAQFERDFNAMPEFLAGTGFGLIPGVGPRLAGGFTEGTAARNAERGMFDGVGTLPKSEINQISLADNTPITLKKALAARASEMALKPNQRVKPRAEDALLRTTPDAYTKLLPDQITTPVPRLPEGRKYPYNERAKILDDNKEQIAQILAERARPFLGTESQYFYHMRGPFLEATRNANIADDVAVPWLNDFAGAYSATSPRTKTDQNFRNATLAMAKKAQGIPYRSVVGEGTAGMSGKPGISEKGFPMMTGKGGIHGKLLDDVDSGGINSDINPKPATFKENAAGNLAGVTVDTHAIRGALHALNEINPGSIPDEWIKSQHLAAYKKDPTKLKPATMINDTLGSVSSKKVSKQVEYAPFSDIYTRMGEILGVSPAEAQAMGWFGSGKLTGLRSEAKSLPSLFNDRLSTTSQLMGITPQEALREVVQKRSIPLLSAGAFPLLGDENDTPFDQLKRKFKGAK